ncbi:MAG: hypothetical protein RBR81_09215 [Bacteroidales bacterium]|jgi:hypothetical protein|nr:hypothetical protein [Bacteroidales bacterium]
MISPGLEVLKSLEESIRDMYFARNVIDYIALNIYYSTSFAERQRIAPQTGK